VGGRKAFVAGIGVEGEERKRGAEAQINRRRKRHYEEQRGSEQTESAQHSTAGIYVVHIVIVMLLLLLLTLLCFVSFSLLLPIYCQTLQKHVLALSEIAEKAKRKRALEGLQTFCQRKNKRSLSYVYFWKRDVYESCV